MTFKGGDSDARVLFCYRFISPFHSFLSTTPVQCDLQLKETRLQSSRLPSRVVLYKKTKQKILIMIAIITTKLCLHSFH